ncbi:WecB/TagA/CpsF family glycosyltransferase [Methylobacterium nigriterrae]|uniref:WecB/TagA/CpsF family glycosyltransferase n=1 Tax=Methylobacterium nigriterrae TaxID=3127512 RepID=UPI003013808A
MLNGVDILGVWVQSGPVHNVVDHIDERVEQRDATRVAFLNAHLSNVCSGNEALRNRLGQFLVLNDGVGVDIARRVLHGRAFPENLNGTDFVTAYLDRTSHDLRLFLLGARPDVVEKAGAIVQERWPRHTVVGTHNGFLDAADEASLRRTIAAARPDLILVGMGNPRQERWIADNVPGVCLCAMAVGAWFDFITGTVPRAPGWIRRARLEWIYRLCIEPRRLASRYLVGNLLFLARLGLARVRLGRFQEG